MISNTSAGSSSNHLATSRALARRALWPVTAFLAALGILIYWNVVVKAPAVTYGDVAKTYFKPALVQAGGETLLCFDAVTWHRTCPSELVTALVPTGPVGIRIDLPTHKISTPVNTGLVEAKCRAWRAPTVVPPGNYQLRGHAIASCPAFGNWGPTVPVITTLPAVGIMVR